MPHAWRRPSYARSRSAHLCTIGRRVVRRAEKSGAKRRSDPWKRHAAGWCKPMIRACEQHERGCSVDFGVLAGCEEGEVLVANLFHLCVHVSGRDSACTPGNLKEAAARADIRGLGLVYKRGSKEGDLSRACTCHLSFVQHCRDIPSRNHSDSHTPRQCG